MSNDNPGSALVHLRNEPMAIVPSTLEQVQTFVKMLIDSPLLPEDLRRNAASVTLMVMRGMELGIPPVQSLSMLHVIKGKVALHATAKRGLCQSRAGCKFSYPVLTAEQVTVKVTRPGYDPVEVTWTIKDAHAAGLPQQNGNWNKYPKKMLVARATSEACDFIAADVVAGLPVIEDVEDYEEVDPRGPGAAFAPAPPAPTASPAQSIEPVADRPRRGRPPRDATITIRDPATTATVSSVPMAIIDAEVVEAPTAHAGPDAILVTVTGTDVWGGDVGADAPSSPIDRFRVECAAATTLPDLMAVRQSWGVFAKANPGDVPAMKPIFNEFHAKLQGGA